MYNVDKILTARQVMNNPPAALRPQPAAAARTSIGSNSNRSPSNAQMDELASQVNLL